MLNFDKYHLVEFLENPTLYEIQKHIISSSVLSQKDKVLKLALLLIQTPICDYETAITLLKDFSGIETDFEILVLGADLNAFLPVLGRSFFISKLKQLYAGKTEKDDAIISYLEAISLDNSASKKFSDKQLIASLLSDSVKWGEKYVNNYYRLSLLSDKKMAKKLMKKALSNIAIIKPDDEPIEDRLTYENYFNEFISGTHIRCDQYALYDEYYESLK